MFREPGSVSALEPFLAVRPEGLRAEAFGAVLDPAAPVPRAILSHAHADHAVDGHGEVWATPETLALYRRRNPAWAGAAKALAYGEEHEENGVRIRMVPAGHVLGSAQVLFSAENTRFSTRATSNAGPRARPPRPSSARLRAADGDDLRPAGLSLSADGGAREPPSGGLPRGDRRGRNPGAAGLLARQGPGGRGDSDRRGHSVGAPRRRVETAPGVRGRRYLPAAVPRLRDGSAGAGRGAHHPSLDRARRDGPPHQAPPDPVSVGLGGPRGGARRARRRRAHPDVGPRGLRGPAGARARGRSPPRGHAPRFRAGLRSHPPRPGAFPREPLAEREERPAADA